MPLIPVQSDTISIAKQKIDFIKTSYQPYGKMMVCDEKNLCTNLLEFVEFEKDRINDETCELLEPYLAMP